MKTILTFLLPLIAIITGVASFRLFANDSYYLSAVCTITAYLSASAWVYLLTRKATIALQ